jgi:hypothetical protein
MNYLLSILIIAVFASQATIWHSLALNPSPST